MSPNSHNKIIDRRARRVRVSCRLFFFGAEDLEGEARLTDLSATGCRAECHTPPAIGTELKLSVFLKEHPWPLKIEGAVVRWIRDQMMGLEFYNVQPASSSAYGRSL